jgi:hypothetical protein
VAPDGYLRGVLADGTRPFRFRGRVRRLLGEPDDAGAKVEFVLPPRVAGVPSGWTDHTGGRSVPGGAVDAPAPQASWTVEEVVELQPTGGRDPATRQRWMEPGGRRDAAGNADRAVADDRGGAYDGGDLPGTPDLQPGTASPAQVLVIPGATEWHGAMREGAGSGGAQPQTSRERPGSPQAGTRPPDAASVPSGATASTGDAPGARDPGGQASVRPSRWPHPPDGRSSPPDGAARRSGQDGGAAVAAAGLPPRVVVEQAAARTRPPERGARRGPPRGDERAAPAGEPRARWEAAPALPTPPAPSLARAARAVPRTPGPTGRDLDARALPEPTPAPEPATPAPAPQPVAVRRAAEPATLVHAFWERSHLNWLRARILR